MLLYLTLSLVRLYVIIFLKAFSQFGMMFFYHFSCLPPPFLHPIRSSTQGVWCLFGLLPSSDILSPFWMRRSQTCFILGLSCVFSLYLKGSCFLFPSSFKIFLQVISCSFLFEFFLKFFHFLNFQCEGIKQVPHTCWARTHPLGNIPSEISEPLKGDWLKWLQLHAKTCTLPVLLPMLFVYRAS